MDEETKIIRWMIFFTGEVQAVGFRYTAYLYAGRTGLTGWVKNLDDGRVQMEVQGRLSDIRKLLTHLKKSPPIRIEDYSIKDIPVRGDETGFAITG